MDYLITIKAQFHARYTDAREAHEEADVVAEHVRESCDVLLDDVKVVSVEATGDAA